MRLRPLLPVALAMFGLAAIAVGVLKLRADDRLARPHPSPPRQSPWQAAPEPLRHLLETLPGLPPEKADQALRDLAIRDPRTLPALCAVLASPLATNGELQTALAGITGVGPPALPAVLEFFLRSRGTSARRAYIAVRHLIPTAGQWRNVADNPFARHWTEGDALAARPFEARLLERTRDPDGNVRRYALLILAALPPAARTEVSVRVLLDGLLGSDSVVRAESSYALMLSAGAARDAVPRLLSILDGDDDEMRDLVFAILARLGRDVPEIGRALATRLERGAHASEQTSLCVSLAQMGENARPALAWFERTLRSEHVHSARTAASCLATLAPLGLPVLGRAAADPEARIRALAAAALGQVGARDRSAAERIVRPLAADPDAEVARQAKIALTRLAPPDSR